MTELSQKLFAVYLGGRARGCSIELHDVVFVVGQTIEETYLQCAHKWFGQRKGLHIDSYIELDYVDNYKIQLNQKPSQVSPNKFLYFVNFGAYLPNVFGEVHQFGFYVAENSKEVVLRAKQELCAGLFQQHVDDKLDVNKLIDAQVSDDDVIQLDRVNNYSLQLIQCPIQQQLKINSSYRKIDVEKLLAKQA